MARQIPDLNLHGQGRLRGCGGRCDRPCGRPPAGARRARSDRAGRGRGHRHRDLLAQQRGDPCRDLLPGRELDGADVRRRQGGALSLLRRARRSLPQLRQADRRDHAEANGVDDMQTLSGDAARVLEPALNCDAALLSPSTGIIDSHAYMLALRGDAEAAGAAFAFHTPLQRARAVAGNIEIEAGGEAPMTLACDLLVNAAGLRATAIARSIEGMPIEMIPVPYL